MSNPFSLLTEGQLVQDRYRIKRLIGKGGMGAVYEAKNERLGNTVALKQNFFGSDEQLKRAFEREARLLANLKHPALPRVTDHFSEDFGQFLVMDFIAGDDLSELLKQRGYPFAVEQVLAWADELLDALSYLHSRKPHIIHRDLKPQNLKLNDEGRVMLLDFGLAKGTTSELTDLTAGKSVVGFTRGYSPLEQITFKGTDARSDLYSLGATLYHLLTNQMPPDAVLRLTETSTGELDPLRPANELNPLVPTALAELLQHSLALKNINRPQSAAEMRKELKRCGVDPKMNEFHEATTVVELPKRIDREDSREVLQQPSPVEKPDEKAHRLKSVPLPPTKGYGTTPMQPPIVIDIPPNKIKIPPTEKVIVPGSAGVSPAASAPEDQQPEKPESRPDLTMAPFTMDLGNGVKMEFVPIPAGSFLMGSENGREDEKPVHRVTISKPFYTGKYPVTQAQWQTLMGSNPSHFKDRGGDCPVEQVSWNDAQAFIRKLNSRDDGNTCRLPSEAEWEYSCRAGTTGDDAGDLDEMGWYRGNSGDTTHPVGQKLSNPWGLYDVYGNVWEWCQDLYHSNYEGAPSDGSAWESDGGQKFHVLRGGSWILNGPDCRSTLRYLREPDDQSYYVGFRVVVSARTP